MSRNATRSIASAGSESVGSGSIRQRSSPARGERPASNPASYTGDNYDTALPSMEFHPPPTMAHRRTGSTLKTVMRKIFNRKRQSQTDGLEEAPYESTFSTPPVRRPGPTGPRMRRPFLAVPPPLNLDSNRRSPLSAENLQLAETHLSPLSPLSPASLGGSLAGGMPPRRRRATLPSVIFSDDESRFAVASAISDPHDDRSVVPEQRRHSLLSDRISRSAEALRELNEQLPPVAAWSSPPPVNGWPPRTTSAPGSTAQSRSPQEESSNSGQSSRPSTGTTVTSVARESAAPSFIGSDQRPGPVTIPPNVASFVGSMQQDDSVTLDQRLTTLEVKMIDLEFAIARMQTSPQDSPTGKAPRPRPPQHADSYPPQTRKISPGLRSPADSTDSASPLPNIEYRPSSTSTIRQDSLNSRTLRPAPSATSLSDYQGVSIEQYSTLVTLLRREQTARRNLESQVTSLRDDIRHLQRAALESIQAGTMQPAHTIESEEFIRFRRALDDSGTSSPLRSDDKQSTIDSDPDWDRSELYSRDDPFAHPPKWERQRIVPAPMI
ncbi:hypothetical protein PENANT_c047G02415 [Penicillium antarcticum]|uniref:Uncharacterized protein n=1 Tax=Penicillium antarcticum TaxID=416450 RepID=A0A1V6PRQ5_9EURO|nr:uncharacterized protein N7508_005023 [Penicillium antarcticum]KAJ5306008.1 hypothetical protein N7508_005023 [Penicillium antarcticum]OQD79623.1 hypothetical protein PENANT_c047G02415 [Penicillium antarcticum]